MKCEKVMYLMVLYMGGEMDMHDQLAMENHLLHCPTCSSELAQLKALHTKMKALPLPEPTDQMRQNFYRMLNEYKGSRHTPRATWVMQLEEQLQNLWLQPYTQRLIFGMLMLLLGWIGGYWLRPDTSMGNKQLTQLTQEVQQMREDMLLTMLERPTATERLKAVSFTSDLDQVDQQVIEALLKTLNSDPNVNVRLVTVEALHQFADLPQVREGLIQSITRQESPLVQIALADVMVALQEKRSVTQFKELLKKEGINEAVKTKIENSIHTLL